MIDTLKNTLLAGLGAAAVTREKMDALLKELVEKGKITRQEAGELAEAYTEKGRVEFNNLQDELSNFFDQGLKQAHVATQKELQALEARVVALEAALLAAEKTQTSE